MTDNAPMKLRLSYVLTLVLLFNLALVAASAFLAIRSTQRHPPIGHLLDADGVQLHVLDSGTPANQNSTESASTASALTLVLIHGASTSLLDFETAIKPALAQRMRIISIDRPGHGYSERGRNGSSDAWMNPARQAQLIGAALAGLGVTRSIWVGHSWAGSVVLAGLLNDELDIEAGVLLAGATHPWQGGAAWHVHLAASPIIGELFSWQYIGPVGRLMMPKIVQQVFSPEAVTPGYVENTGLVLSLRPATYQHNAEDLTRLSDYLQQQSQHYATIEQPLLSITGSHDTVVPAWNHDQRLARQVVQMQSVQLPGAGHALHHTRSAEIVGLISHFVDTLDSQPRQTRQ
jgi:pimeloyl-ACP methyl ester carboxylesterase